MTTFEPIALAEMTTTPLAASELVLDLPLGLLGFEHIKRYLLVSRADEAPFSWLQVADEPTLNFLVLPPFAALSDYRPSFGNADVEFLELDGPSDALLFGIVTLRPHNQATINLKGPILVNRHTWRAKQAILTNAADYSLHHPLPVSNENSPA